MPSELRSTKLPELDAGEAFPKKLEREIEERHRHLISGLDEWIEHEHAVESLFWVEKVSIWALALFATLKSLAGHGAVAVPIVSWKDKEGTPRKVVFA